MKVELIKGGVKLHDIYKLRFVVFCEEVGFINEDLYPNKEESDEFDKNSEFLAAYSKGELVGCIRVVKDINNGLPTEKFSNFSLYKKPKSNYVEFSRFAVLKHGRNIYTIFTLIKAAIMVAHMIGATDVVFTTSANKERKYKQFGFRKIIGPYKYEGVNDPKKSITMATNLIQSKGVMKEINPLFNYFLNKNLVEINLK